MVACAGFISGAVAMFMPWTSVPGHIRRLSTKRVASVRLMERAVMRAVERYAKAMARGLLVLPLLAGWSGMARAAADRLTIHVLSDRLTLSVTGHPQVYLYGHLDADAPARFARLVAAGRIARGSDVYLSSREGDVAAGMALGRMLRAGGMATHLSAPRPTFPHAGKSRVALCADACAYAFFGGLYRWAPSGSDRLGLTVADTASSPGLPEAQAAYLASMGVDAAALVAGASAGMRWLDGARLKKAGAVNDGRLPPTARYDILGTTPTLDLRQVDRKGEHRLTVRCEPGHTRVTAYERVGAQRAREIVARGPRSYLALDGRSILVADDGVQAEGEYLVIRRDYPPSNLVDLLFAGSIGAWVDGRSAAFRDGFTLQPWGVYGQLKVFYHACWRAAPWPPRQHAPR